jgi:hypothetical protein
LPQRQVVASVRIAAEKASQFRPAGWRAKDCHQILGRPIGSPDRIGHQQDRVFGRTTTNFHDNAPRLLERGLPNQ